MKLVLLSGGSGKRLWPLSNDSRSKQFLKVLVNPEGRMESMVQRVWRQLTAVRMNDSTYTITGAAQLEILQNQIGVHKRVLVEPERRDTFPAIALAATYLYSIEGLGLDEVIGVLPVDPYVEERFFESVKALERTLADSGADIALVGVKPLHASEKYGYIVPDEPSDRERPYRNVRYFKEKPSESQAEELIRQHALWNCGVFAFRLGYLIDYLVKKGFPIQYEAMLRHYEKLPKRSFDYELVEKADRIVVTSYEGYWKDLGTWNTLTDEMSQKQLGNAMISEDSHNTHVVNEMDIPITVVGLSDVIVAASPDGVLVSDKSKSPRIKEMLKHVDRRPMYEERQWGNYRVLDYKRAWEGEEVLTKRISIESGKGLEYEMHMLRDEVAIIVSGTGTFTMGGVSKRVGPGDVLQIPAGYGHSIKAISDLEFIEVQRGGQLLENDCLPASNHYA